MIYTVNNSSLIHLEMQLIHFEKVTDTKYNKTKCLGIWIGSKNGDRRKPLGFKWNSVSMKILGYTYGHNTNKYRNKTEKSKKNIRKNIRKWGHLQLSLIEKKVLINQAMLSKIWYLRTLSKTLEKTYMICSGTTEKLEQTKIPSLGL